MTTDLRACCSCERYLEIMPMVGTCGRDGRIVHTLDCCRHWRRKECGCDACGEVKITTIRHGVSDHAPENVTTGIVTPGRDIVRNLLESHEAGDP